MKISEISLNALVKFIIGDQPPAPRMSGPELIKFFNAFGIQDKYSHVSGGLPESDSRRDYTYKTLLKLNGGSRFSELVECIVDSRRVEDSELIANQVHEVIKHDGYSLERNEDGIYKINGRGVGEIIDIESHFEEIKSQIIQSIRNSKYTIWIAVAWFTDRDIGNELWKKHKNGINVQVIVNDDKITQKNGLPFGEHGIEYYKISPSSKWGKKLMHNKFCIIDLNKVINGSYNWTSNATFNNENITITESRELAEEFSSEFILLKTKIK
jgi:hypothetical protein